MQDKLALFNTENQKDYYLKLHLLFSEYSGDDSNSFIKESFKRFEMHKKKQNSYDFIMQNEILEGLKNGDFKTFLQPKIFSQEKRIEFEALIRWFHPKKGLISPERFIPIAEKSFAIHKITDMVIKDAISTAIEMNTNISVNISPIVFNHPNFIKDMEKIFMNTEHSRFVSL